MLEQSPKAESRRPLRILYATNSVMHGGTERRLIYLSNEAVARGHRVRVVAMADRIAMAAQLDPAVEIVSLGHRRGLPLRAAWRLWRQLREFRPDVVQTFLHIPNRVGLVLARLARTPAVVSTLGTVPAYVPAHLAAVDRFCFRFADCALANSPEVLEFHRDRWRFPAGKLRLIPGCVPLDRIPFRQAAWRGEVRAELGIAEGEPALVLVGRLTEAKGHSVLLEAVAAVAAEHPEARWWLVGDGPLRPAIEQLVAERGLTERVVFVGLRDDVPRLLQGMDLFVLSSLWEGMPNAVMEAMAAGCPVIGTLVGGMRQLVEPGETGWLVPPGDAAALATALSAALSDPTRWPAMGAAGRARIEAEYSLEAILPRYFAVYDELLASRPGRP